MSVTLNLNCIHLTEDNEKTYTCTIYRDDTIDNVKFKLSQQMDNKNVDEYYFFTKQLTRMNPYEQYKKWSYENTRTITYEVFASFCLNHELSLPPKKDSYELDDFLELPEEVMEYTPVGIVHGTPFVVNPFKNVFPQQEDSGTQSKTLWLTLPDTIYVCFAKDVYAYSESVGLEMAKVFNTYYPYLYKEGKLEPSLFTSKEKVDYTEYNKMIDFHQEKYDPKFIVSEGITSLYFVMYTLESFFFPLDIFFKLFQSSYQNPYIKMNGQKTHENIYRLFCNQQNESGYKIPYLKKKTILKYAHDINKNSISYLFYANDIPLFLNMNKKGHLYFKLEQIPFLSIEAIEVMIKDTIHSFSAKLFEYFDPSKKIFTHFEHLHQSNVSILDMKYKCQYKKEGKLNIPKYMGCFSPMFNFMNEKDKIILRYKRVSNYNESQSKDAYLIEAFNQAIPIDEMILLFSANFMKHDDKAAADYIHQFFSTIEIEEKQNNLRRVKINPGFLVEVDKKDSTLIEATVHTIDHIEYIPFLRVYLTNLIMISQGIISDENKCKKIKEIEVKEIAAVKPLFEENVNFRMNDELEQIEDPDDYDMPSENEVQENEVQENKVIENDTDLSPDELPEKEKELTPPSENELPANELPSNELVENALTPPSENEVQENEVQENEVQENEVPANELVENDLTPPSENEVQENEVQENEVPANEVQENEVPANEVSENDLTPPSNNENRQRLSRVSGGTIAESKSYEVFIYDDNDPYTIQKRFKKDPLREGKITDYFRVFQGSECTLVKKEGESCKGYVVELEGSQLKELVSEATFLFVDYFDKPGNSYSGVTYVRELTEWNDHPPIQFVKKVYATVAYGWKHKQDDRDDMYIYDKDNQLKARYDGKYYVKLDEDEELTKIQFTPVNPLLQRLQEREPLLFTKTDKTHNQYSRICLWSEKRQPIILSKEEKERIDEISPGSYESAIEYSTDPKKPYYYICPRYWDLKHNLPVHPDKVDKSKLISRNASDSEKQKNIQSRYILELAKPGEKPVYQTRPGFLTKKHPNGFYMPCCFISKPKKDKPDAIDKRIQEASQYFKRSVETEDPIEKVKDYIQNGDKFPLTENRKGHLTPILEKFFQLNYSDCYSQIQKRKLKINYPCLLRQGVNESQSFLSSISFLYFKKSVPLETFLKLLLEKITIDTLLTFHNGGLVDTFAKDVESQTISDEHKKSKLFKTMNRMSFQKVVSGYEHFVQYLRNKEYKDYTYLWDIITQVLFKERVNMIILKEGLEDVTHNLNIVCPTTAHALYRFDEKYPSILIYQKGLLFEPLYIYKKVSEGKDKTITQFELSENLPSVNDILKKIHATIGDTCKERTIHKSYTFKENLYLHDLLDELKKTTYTVEKQVMNIDGRIFGVMVNKESKSKSFFVPCTPSAVSGDYLFIDDVEWLTYRDTVLELKRLHEESDKRIPCQPKIRVLENEMIVGILTETNQFVSIQEPEENKVKDDLLVLDERNPRLVNEVIQTGPMQPKEKVIHYLKLEQMFYHAFFNTLKVELNDSKNLMVRKQIEKALPVKDKNTLDRVFEPIFREKFLFVDNYEVDLDDIHHINLCKENDAPYCGKLEHEGKLLIPMNNLFNQSNNQESYKRRFIDDLLMNIHTQRILLEEIHSTLYYTDRYQLTDMEILLLESDLNTYLDKEPVKRVESVRHPMLEDVQPSKLIEVAETIEPMEESESIQVKDEMDIPDEPEPEPEPEPVINTLPTLEPDPIEVNLDEPEDDPLEPMVLAPIEESESESNSESSEPEPEPEKVKKPRPNPVRSRKIKPESAKSVRPAPVKGKRIIQPTPQDRPQDRPQDIPTESISLNDEPIQPLRPNPVKTRKLKTNVQGTSLDNVTVVRKEPTDKNIESLSHKIKKNEEVKNVVEAEEYVKTAKEYHQVLKSAKTENLVLLAQEHLKELNPSLMTKIKRIELDLIPCIKTFYFKGNSKWKSYFPPKTIGFRIMKGDTYESSVIDLTCNFIMALQILKSYDPKYKELTIRNLKDMMIQGYSHLSETVDDLYKKFRKEKKRFTSWSEIQMESYPFTQLDLIVLMIEYKLPVVIFIQAKKKIKLLTYHTEDTFKYYIKMKKKDVFMFFIANHDFKIERRDMGPLYHTERDIVYLNDPASLLDYMKHYT
jgi:hypothetical protein